MEKRIRQTPDTAEFFGEIERNASTLVQPSLVAIYEEITEPRSMVHQIGIGFRIRHRGRPALITAKHTLYGKKGDENPADKAIFVSGRLELIGNLSSTKPIPDDEHDLAAMYLDEFSLADCLPFETVCQVEAKPRWITILGFLARDFRREAKSEMLRPSPFAYTNSRKESGDGYIGMLYPKSRNRSTQSGMKVQAPIPRGLSGGPMLDSARLAAGQVSIIGVFTNYVQERGIAFGESSSKIIALLHGL